MRGTIVFETEMIGDNGPEYKILLAPEAATPIDQNVSISAPPVQTGNTASAVRLITLPAIVNPLEERATSTRA